MWSDYRRKLKTIVAAAILGAAITITAAVSASGPNDHLLGDPSVRVLRVYVVGWVLLHLLLLYDLWRSDELERRVYYVGTATAFVGTGVVTLVYGLMQRMGWPYLNWGFVFMVQIGFFCVGLGGAWLRYR